MPKHVFPLRAAAFASLALAGACALAEVPANAEIYQQRAADGSIVLTDRPSPKAVTERTWQMQHEDAGAAQRALDVRREAQAVSERVQRQIDAQQRRADADMMRMRVARLDAADEGYEDDLGYGYGYGGGLLIGGGYAHRHRGPYGGHHQGVSLRPGRGGPGGGASHGAGGFSQR